ncbi:MAG: hypothetical protein AAFQ99_08800 [Pseudomonadota bacterium]
MNPLKTIQRTALVALVSFSLVACGGLLTSDAPPKQVFWLMPVDTGASADPNGQTLAITITAAPGLDTDRWLALEPTQELRAYSSAYWPDNAPDFLESILRQTFARTGQWDAVHLAEHAYKASVRLDLVLEEHLVVLVSREVRTRVSGQITCGETSLAMGISLSMPVATDSLSDIAEVHQQLSDRLGVALVEAVSRECLAL